MFSLFVHQTFVHRTFTSIFQPGGNEKGIETQLFFVLSELLQVSLKQGIIYI